MIAQYSSKYKSVDRLSREAYSKHGNMRYFVVFECGRVHVFETESEWFAAINDARLSGLAVRCVF